VTAVSKFPDEAAEHFSWLAPFLCADIPASSALTQEFLGWRPTQPGLVVDLDHASSFEALADRAKSSPMLASPAHTNRSAICALNVIAT
jgi:hypothetical protein